MLPEVYLRSDGIEYQPRGDDFDTVGHICKREEQLPYVRIRVLQDSVNWRNRCASNWITIPHDELWTLCRPGEEFLSKVQVRNLDFRGTPFEHRHNEYAFRRQFWILSCMDNSGDVVWLSEQERNIWGAHFETFVPFKRPNPQGYQGVWGDFDCALTDLWSSLYVYDTFDSGIHALKVS